MMSQHLNASPATKTDNDFQAPTELIKLGMEMVEAGTPTISPEAIHAWMLGPDDAPFPKPDIFEASIRLPIIF